MGGQGSSNSCSERKEKSKSWSQSATFTPQQADNGPQQLAPDDIHRDWNPIDYFNQHVDNNLYSLISQDTNQTAMIQTGHSLGTTPKEIRKFFGVNIMMRTLKYPRIRMYWSKSTGVTSIKNAMKHDRFFKLWLKLWLMMMSQNIQNKKTNCGKYVHYWIELGRHVLADQDCHTAVLMNKRSCSLVMLVFDSMCVESPIQQVSKILSWPHLLEKFWILKYFREKMLSLMPTRCSCPLEV